MICALLRLQPKDIKTIVIKNPINLSSNLTGKELILDINVMLNNEILINLEMQVANADEIVRQQCIAREDAERRERTLEKVAEQHRLAREEAEREVARLKTLLEKIQ